MSEKKQKCNSNTNVSNTTIQLFCVSQQQPTDKNIALIARNSPVTAEPFNSFTCYSTLNMKTNSEDNYKSIGDTKMSFDNYAFSDGACDKNLNSKQESNCNSAVTTRDLCLESCVERSVVAPVQKQVESTESHSHTIRENVNKLCSSAVTIHTSMLSERERCDSMLSTDALLTTSLSTLCTVLDETTEQITPVIPLVTEFTSFTNNNVKNIQHSNKKVCMGTHSLPSVELAQVDANIMGSIEEGHEIKDPQHVNSRKKRPIRMDSNTSADSSVMSEGRGCRICWNNEEKENFIQPCNCTGSSANVHVSCLKKWLQVTNKFTCEICNFKYNTTSVLKPVWKWSWRCSKSRYISQLEATLVLLGIVTPPLICGIVLCSQKIVDFVNYPENIRKTAGSFAALMTLVITSSLTYFFVLLYSWGKITIVLRRWMQSNKTTIVQLGGVDTVIQHTVEVQPSRETDTSRTGDVYPIWTIS